MENKQVVVLGIHRSGTSMVAGMLRHMGVFMGEDLIGKSKYNVMGHFEDRAFMHINEAILTVTGGSWEVPPSKYQVASIWSTIPDDGEDWGAHEKRRHEVLKRMTGEVALRNTTNKIWGFKDPRTVLTLEAWMPLLSKPKLVVVYRNFDSIVSSLYNREKIEGNALGICKVRVEMLVALYFFRLRDLIMKYPDHFIIQYEYALNNPELVAMRLADYVGVKCTKEAMEFIDPRIRNF